jgi:hypothetical protein
MVLSKLCCKRALAFCLDLSHQQLTEPFSILAMVPGFSWRGVIGFSWQWVIEFSWQRVLGFSWQGVLGSYWRWGLGFSW